MSLQDAPQLIRPYIFHGVDLDYSNKRHPKEAIGTCPYCDKEDHFYVNRSTGLYDCKRCGEKGNVARFLQTFHALAFESTSEEDYRTLSEDRGVPVEALKRYGVAVSPLRGKWIIPVYNSKGKLSNLLLWLDSGPMGTPTCSHHLLGAHELKKSHKTVWVVEGIWDLIAWDYLLGSLKLKRMAGGYRYVQTRRRDESLLTDNHVVACPGSGNFQAEWGKLLADRDVKVCFDNDHPKKHPKTGKVTKPGWDGTKRTAAIIATYAESVDWLRWGKSGYTKKLPDGFDLRDILLKWGVAKGFTYVTEKLEVAEVEPTSETPTEVDNIDALERRTYSALCEDYSAALHFTDNLRDTLALMLAVVISTELEGDQLWIRVIGPPGSGKSTLAESILAAGEYVIATDILTGIASGFTGGGRSKKDASLVDQFSGKTIVIHDADTLINSPNRDSILREFRAFYGGNLRARYRNRQTKLYADIKTTWILCGTDDMRNLNRTFLGERFLDCEILGDADTAEYLDRALDNTYARVIGGLAPANGEVGEASGEGLLLLKRATKGYIVFLKEGLSSTSPPAMSVQARETLKAFGEFLSFARARFAMSKEDFEYRPRKELGTRLVSQFTKFAVSLAVVLGKPDIDDEVLRLVRKVVLDTAHGYQIEIMEALHKHTAGLSSSQLATVLDIPESTVRRILIRMQTAKIITRRSVTNKSGQRGRNVHLWILTKEVRGLASSVWPKTARTRTRKRAPRKKKA